MKIIVRWLLLAAALLLVAQVYAGVSVASFSSALIAALVLGLFNTLVRPLLVLLTLPVTLLTLGLFLFVINALMFWAAASVLDGFNVAGFGAALIGSLLYSLCGLVIDAATDERFGAAASVSALRLRSVLAVPLVAAGRPIGCVYVDVDRRYFHSNLGVPAEEQYAEWRRLLHELYKEVTGLVPTTPVAPRLIQPAT